MHPNENAINEYVDGTLESRDRADLEQHLASCVPCRQAVEDLREILGATRALAVVIDTPWRVPEVAAHLRVDPETVRRWLRAHKLRGVLLSQQGGYRISNSELQRRDIRQLLAGAIDLVCSQMGATLGRHNVAQRADAMNDTSAAVSKIVEDHHLAMTPAERWLAASSLFESARRIVESSLPMDLTMEERRLAVVRRFYGSELPEVALIAHSRYVDSAASS
jgi:hypothetical protein